MSRLPTSRQARADAERQYQPFVHNPGAIGVKTGRPMPALGEVRRTGPDQIEDIDEFFRSPTSTNARLAPASFASLGDSPGGYDEGDGDGDVGRAVEEAMERDQGMDLGSDSVGGTPSRYFRSKDLNSAPFPSASRARTPPAQAPVPYAHLPSPSPTRPPRNANPASSSRTSRLPSLARPAHSEQEDEDEEEEVEHARLTSRNSTRPSTTFSRAGTSPSRDEFLNSPVRRPSMAPSRALTSPGSEQGDDSVNVRFDDGFDDDAGADWGGGQPDEGEGDVTMEVYDDPSAGGGDGGFSEGEGGAGSPVVPLEDEEDEEEERVIVEKRRTSKGKRPRVDDDSEEEGEGYVHHHHEAQHDDGDEQMDDHQPAVYSDNDNDDDGGQSPPVADRTDASDDEAAEEVVQKPTKGKGRPKKVRQVGVDSGEEGEERTIGAREKGKGRAYQPKVALQPKIVPLPDSDRTSDSDDDGSRRSKRQRFRPLEYWRGEKLIFGRANTGKKAAVPVVKAVQELPEENRPSFAQKRKVGRPRAGAETEVKKEGKKRSKRSESGEEETPVETGWDRETKEHGVVFDYVTKQEIERRIAFPSHLVEYRTMSSDPNGFKFQKVFGDASFVAAGMLEIPVGGEKPSKPTKDNTYLFYVIEGAVNVKIHRTTFTMAVGGQFMVPRGNQYSIHTISRRPAKLFFAQARRMAADEEDVPPVLTASQAPPPKTTASAKVGSKK